MASDERAVERCLAPIDPSVFDKLGAREKPEKPRKGSNPRRRPAPVEPAGPCDRSSVECAYFEARNHFEERRFDLAARGFRKLAFEGEVNQEGLFAGQLALEALNLLGSNAEPPRPECFDLIASDNDRLIERYCQKPLLPEREDSCFTFFRIARDVRRLHTEQLIRTADSGTADKSRLYEQAGDEYRAMFDESCPPSVTQAQAMGVRCDELLFNAQRAFRAAGARAKADAAYRTFFDPRSGLAESELAKKLGEGN